MNAKIKLSLQLFAIVTLSITIALVARKGFAWTSPSSNPPGGSGVITVSGGNVGIGTASPASKLEVHALSSSYVSKFVQDSTSGHGVEVIGGDNPNNNALNIHGLGIGTDALIVKNNGNIGIGTVTPSAGLKLDVEGKVGATEYCDNSGANCKTTAAMGGGVPTGAIMPFYLASCPSGWISADGTNSTPDLRSRFIIGSSGTYGYNTTGGEAAHTLTISEMPQHRHAVIPMSVVSAYAPGMTNGGQGWPDTYPGYGQYTTYEGGSAAHNTLPPYRSLTYCMKQ